MKVTYDHHFDASIEDVIAMFSNEAFAAQRASASGAAGSDVLVDIVDDGSFTVVIRRTIPADAIPSEFRAFVGSQLHVRYTEAGSGERLRNHCVTVTPFQKATWPSIC